MSPRITGRTTAVHSHKRDKKTLAFRVAVLVTIGLVVWYIVPDIVLKLMPREPEPFANFRTNLPSPEERAREQAITDRVEVIDAIKKEADALARQVERLSDAGLPAELRSFRSPTHVKIASLKTSLRFGRNRNAFYEVDAWIKDTVRQVKEVRAALIAALESDTE